MSDTWKIILSALAVFALAFILWLIPILRDGRRLRRERKQAAWRRGTRARNKEAYERMQKLRAEVGAPVLDLPEDDDTKTWPVIPVAK